MRDEKTRKAYVVFDVPHEYATCYLYAENASKAKYDASLSDESGQLQACFPTNLRALRRPDLDAEISTARLHELGLMWSECPGCYSVIHSGEFINNNDENTAFICPGREMWCSKACYEAHKDKPYHRWGSTICFHDE